MKHAMILLSLMLILTLSTSALACDGILYGPALRCNQGSIVSDVQTHIKNGIFCTLTAFDSYATEQCLWCSMIGNTRCGPYLCYSIHDACGKGRENWCTREHY